MPLTWEADRAPFLDSRGQQRVHERMLACASEVEKSFKLTPGVLRRSRRLGCGFYGCAYLLPGMPTTHAVIKVTSDPLEANVAMRIAREGKPKVGSGKKRIKCPSGLLRIHGIRSLGRCSITPLLRDRRPLWVIWREELPDAWPVLKRRGIKLVDFRTVLMALSYYLDDQSQRTSFKTFGHNFIFAPDREDLVVMLERIGGVSLLEACEWLLDHDMFSIDVIKDGNIGWRDGTGLVLRDVGATEAGFDVRGKIRRAGTASGQI